MVAGAGRLDLRIALGCAFDGFKAKISTAHLWATLALLLSRLE